MSLNLVTETGSYVGDGIGQSISIGWQPALVMIVSSRTQGPAAQRAISFKSSDMSQDLTLLCATDTEYGGGITLINDGFSVGVETRVNHASTTFYWMAIKAGAHLDTGTFVGDLQPTQTITTNRQPDAVLLFKISENPNAPEMFWKFSSMSGAYAGGFTSEFTYAGFRITLQSTGFLCGSACKIYDETYVWVALYAIAGDTQHTESDSYVGTGNLHTITLGYQPSYVIIADEDGTAVCTKFDNIPAGSVGHLDTQYDYEDSVVSITSTGFTLPVGSSANQVNVTYNYVAGRY